VFPNRPIRLACYVLIGWCSLVAMSTFFVTLFICTPTSYIWTGWAGETEGHCINQNHFWYSQASLNIVSDLAVIIVPLPRVFYLQLSPRKKISLFFMFSIGLM
jgi:hypothetical protein